VRLVWVRVQTDDLKHSFMPDKAAVHVVEQLRANWFIDAYAHYGAAPIPEAPVLCSSCDDVFPRLGPHDVSATGSWRPVLAMSFTSSRRAAMKLGNERCRTAGWDVCVAGVLPT
jgi:hypothetical protein